MRLAPGVHSPRVALVLLLLALLASYASGTTYFVNTSTAPGACAPSTLCAGCLQCPSIRSALSAAVNNDQVYLLPGEYSGSNNTNICMGYPCDFKGVSLGGFGRPEEVIISGVSNPSSEFPRGVNATFNSFTTISNITFIGLRCNSAQSDLLSQRVVDVAGAAMLIVGSKVVLRNLNFFNNTALSGGAVAVYGSEVVFEALNLEGNAATSLGGGVLLVSSNATITSSTFVRNNVSSTLTQDLTGAGGALYFSGTEDQALHITNCVFRNNSAQRSGGAMHLQPAGLFTGKGVVVVEASVFSDNFLVGLSTCLTTSSCNSMGGAVYISANDASFSNCSFTNNFAMVASSTTDIGQGGAIFSTTVYVFKAKSQLAVSSTNFSHNVAAGAGGALFISNQNYFVKDCYFVENLAFTVDPLFSTFASQGGAMWFSNGALQGRMANVVFEKNMARSGWGGAIYGTASSQLTVINSRFSENAAVSSYSNAALGGAVMVTNQVQLNLTSTLFESNHARPNYTTIPLTYSGSGGAIFAQSAGISFNSCEFVGNSAYTGQFDSGSTGGAIVIEDCQPMTIYNCLFTENYASGYVGSSSYASSGNGGALYVKFSVANINRCQFIRNWVSAGGVSNSLGGAVAAFFDYSSVASSSQGVQINDTAFINNTAYGQLCSSLQAGTAGAIGIVGVTTPPVQLRDVVFIGNMAVRTANNQGVSLGGAVSVSLSSEVYMYNSRFSNNFALYGVGNDLISITASNDDNNFIYLNGVQFDGVETTLSQRIKDISNNTHMLCEQLNEFIESLDDIQVQSLGSLHRKLETQFSAPVLGRWVTWSGNQSLHDVVAELTPDTSSAGFNYTLWSSLRDKLLSDTQQSSRALSITPSFTQSDLMNFMPGIALTAGLSTFEQCRFSSSYHIFVGDYGSLLSGQSSTDDLSASTDCKLQIIGNISSADLVITLVEASVIVDLYNANDTISVSQVNIFNGSLIFSNGIFVTGTSFLFAALLQRAGSRFHNTTEWPVAITFLSDILTGYSVMQVTGSSLSVIQMIHRRIGNITTNSSAQSVLVFDACDVHISGTIYLDSPYRGINIVSNLSDNAHAFSNCKLELKNNATINIAETGSMILFTSTSIVADHYSLPAILNSGHISLLGASASPFQRGALASLDDIGSLSSVLTVNGQFVQNTTGQVHLVLNTSGQDIPVLNLIDNTLLGGMINVSFHDDPSLVLYDTDEPTSFTIISYTNTSLLSSAAVMPTIVAPTGLYFLDQVAYTSSSKQYQQQLVIDKIACEQINYDYQGVKSALNTNLYPCYICLKNTSCVLCEDTSGSQYCAGAGMCGAGKTVYSSQCCSTNCNPPYGSCEGKDGNTKFKCQCSTWFYTGTECDQLSLTAIIVIFTGTFLVTTALLSTFLYRKSVAQKQQVLEELREGILRHTESANNEYILNMQQALILNDVFVKFEEIKLESKVGEGSYGVVHKATFRGAQVAVKQMRSMFFELTDKEIEEFRREAYVMSRLRHPNIVLVMGISLVDQEPVAFPKTRTLNSLEDWDQANDKKKSKPQKTVCIITEFLEQGSLADILYGPTRLPAEIWTYELILACALQAARGMLYLHSHQPPICHRDLKSSNLVVDDHWVVKVTDFGMSRIVPEKVQEMDKGVGDDERESIGRDSVGDFSRHEAGSIMVTPSSGTNSASRKTGSLPSSNSQFRNSITAPEMTSNMGTTAWCAPEILTASNRTRYSVKVDVYSFGMVLWELWEKKRPFDEYSSRFDIVDAVRAGKRPAISDNCPPAYKALIQRCWHTEPSRRPMFHYIVRYLKDELGRVKRQKVLPIGGPKPSMYVRPSDTSSAATSQQQQQQQPPPFHASTAVQVIPPATMRRTLHAGVGEEGGGQVDDRQSRRLNATADTVSPMHASKAEGLVVETQSSSADPSHAADSDVPQGRTPLVKAFDRSLSYLTESPGLDSPVLARHLQDPTGITHLGPNSRASNNWRDRYVMRFSGWNSAKPDAGLPPSLTALTPPAANVAQQSQPIPSEATADESGAIRENLHDRQESSSPTLGPAIFSFDPEQAENPGQRRI